MKRLRFVALDGNEYEADISGVGTDDRVPLTNDEKVDLLNDRLLDLATVGAMLVAHPPGVVYRVNTRHIVRWWIEGRGMSVTFGPWLPMTLEPPWVQGPHDRPSRYRWVYEDGKFVSVDVQASAHGGDASTPLWRIPEDMPPLRNSFGPMHYDNETWYTATCFRDGYMFVEPRERIER